MKGIITQFTEGGALNTFQKKELCQDCLTHLITQLPVPHYLNHILLVDAVIMVKR